MSDSLYHSPWEAYPFLSDAADDLRCDFELLTDDMASRVGLMRAEVENPALRAELLFVCELLYHCNPTLRTRCTVTPAERERLLAAAARGEQEPCAPCVSSCAAGTPGCASAVGYFESALRLLFLSRAVAQRRGKDGGNRIYKPQLSRCGFLVG